MVDVYPLKQPRILSGGLSSEFWVFFLIVTRKKKTQYDYWNPVVWKEDSSELFGVGKMKKHDNIIKH